MTYDPAKRAASLRRYDASPKGRAKQVRYRHGDAGRAAQARYDASPKGRARRHRYNTESLGAAISKARWLRKHELLQDQQELARAREGEHEVC